MSGCALIRTQERCVRRPFGPAVTGFRLRGRAAEVRDVPDRTPIDPDSGGCRAYGCADEVFDADRVLLGNYQRIEMHRSRC